ncbi:MAG: ABC-2 family transporter protein [Candidatus Levybacteria bacterium]|nr:ABC-2 family transporter protein [Candidatus Levybacteria bacterium]
MKRYFVIWLKLTGITTQIAFQSRFGAIVFLLGKILRFAFFLFFLVLVTQKTQLIAGYTTWQILFFYATFNLIDTLPQFFLREVYRFRWQVVSGHFDTILTRPISPLFRSLFGGSDVLDISILFLSIIFIFIAGSHIGQITGIQILLYIMLIINAFIIALAFHITVLGMGILTTEVDNTIMLYRDLTQMGRVPIDVYLEPLRGLITFIIPVGIMMTFPVKAMMGLLSPETIVISFAIAAVFLLLSLQFWNYSLKHYASASS